MCDEIVYMFDSYMKKSIRNCVKRYAKKELTSKMREISIDSISEELENKETAFLSDKDNYAVFDIIGKSSHVYKNQENFVATQKD